jgi:hypothetical protein
MQGLRRIVMEVHTADPLEPPQIISKPHIPYSQRSVEGVLRTSGSNREAFPNHAIVYLDLLYKAEVSGERKQGALLTLS